MGIVKKNCTKLYCELNVLSIRPEYGPKRQVSAARVEVSMTMTTEGLFEGPIHVDTVPNLRLVIAGTLSSLLDHKMVKMMMYEYFRKVQGNVCMDWTLTHDLLTTVETKEGPKTVNTQAFKQFLNPEWEGTEPGSCQSLGYKSKQLKFSAFVKPPKHSVQASSAIGRHLSCAESRCRVQGEEGWKWAVQIVNEVKNHLISCFHPSVFLILGPPRSQLSLVHSAWSLDRMPEMTFLSTG
eukprot:606745-Rhodomonas_salina.1